MASSFCSSSPVVKSERVVCIAGKGNIAVQALQYANSKIPNVVCLPVEADDGVDSWAPSLRKLALDEAIEIVSLSDLFNVDGLLLLSLEYDRLIDVRKFASESLFNIHFSRLPAYKGCFTSVWPLYFGEKAAGVTLHEIDAGIDTGPVIDQISFSIAPHVTARELYHMYHSFGFELFKRNFLHLLRGNFDSVPQVSEGSSYFSRSSLGGLPTEVNFVATAFQVANFVRALYFPEYQTATVRGQPVEYVAVETNRSNLAPGTLVMSQGKLATFATVDFDITLRLI